MKKFTLTRFFLAIVILLSATYAYADVTASRIYISNASTTDDVNLHLSPKSTAVPDLAKFISKNTVSPEVYAGGFNSDENGHATIDLFLTFGNTMSGYHTGEVTATMDDGRFSSVGSRGYMYSTDGKTAYSLKAGGVTQQYLFIYIQPIASK